MWNIKHRWEIITIHQILKNSIFHHVFYRKVLVVYCTLHFSMTSYICWRCNLHSNACHLFSLWISLYSDNATFLKHGSEKISLIDLAIPQYLDGLIPKNTIESRIFRQQAAASSLDKATCVSTSLGRRRKLGSDYHPRSRSLSLKMQII